MEFVFAVLNFTVSYFRTISDALMRRLPIRWKMFFFLLLQCVCHALSPIKKQALNRATKKKKTEKEKTRRKKKTSRKK